MARRGRLGGWMHKMPRGIAKIALAVAIIAFASQISNLLGPYLVLTLGNNAPTDYTLLANLTNATAFVEISEANYTEVMFYMYYNNSGTKSVVVGRILLEGNYTNAFNGQRNDTWPWAATIVDYNGTWTQIASSTLHIPTDIRIYWSKIFIESRSGYRVFAASGVTDQTAYYAEIYVKSVAPPPTSINLASIASIIVAFAGLFMLKSGLEEAGAIRI